MVQYLSQADLVAGLDHIKASPRDVGRLELIVIRPEENERTVLTEVGLATGNMPVTFQLPGARVRWRCQGRSACNLMQADYAWCSAPFPLLRVYERI